MFERDEPDYQLVRPKILDAFDWWACFARMPGHFAQACLKNDLADAICRDSNHGEDLHAIVLYIHNELPGRCHGSEEAILAWAHKDNARMRANFRSSHPVFQRSEHDEDNRQYNLG